MDALSLLLSRQSSPRLTAPAPAGEALQTIMQAAVRVPDHAGLTPWRFIVCEGKGLDKLGGIFEQSAIENGKSDKEIERAPVLPLRAPMVIVAIMQYTEHDKVPRVEQIASASCAVMAMQLAAQALEFGSMWRSGSYAQCDVVKAALGCSEEDEIVGFLYLGTNAIPCPLKAQHDTSKFFETWS